MKYSVTVTLKKDVLDPQGKVVQNTLANLGMESLKSIRQGKFFEIEIDENDQKKASEKVEEMCKKLLVNLIIEDYKLNTINIDFSLKPKNILIEEDVGKDLDLLWLKNNYISKRNLSGIDLYKLKTNY